MTSTPEDPIPSRPAEADQQPTSDDVTESTGSNPTRDTGSDLILQGFPAPPNNFGGSSKQSVSATVAQLFAPDIPATWYGAPVESSDQVTIGAVLVDGVGVRFRVTAIARQEYGGPRVVDLMPVDLPYDTRRGPRERRAERWNMGMLTALEPAPFAVVTDPSLAELSPPDWFHQVVVPTCAAMGRPWDSGATVVWAAELEGPAADGMATDAKHDDEEPGTDGRG